MATSRKTMELSETGAAAGATYRCAVDEYEWLHTLALASLFSQAAMAVDVWGDRWFQEVSRRRTDDESEVRRGDRPGGQIIRANMTT